MENERAKIGGNNPPEPIADALAPHDAVIAEAQNWTDGEKVENIDQMKAVDTLIKGMKLAKKDVTLAEKSAATPLYDEWKAEKARWKPTIDDLDRIVKALVATVDPFKRKLAVEKAEAEKVAWAKANAARLEAEKKAREADASNLEAQREAQQALEAAQAADKAARVARDDKPKGLRNVPHYEIVDMRALVNFIAKNDKPAMADFAEEYARKNHKKMILGGDDVVKQWKSKEAY